VKIEEHKVEGWEEIEIEKRDPAVLAHRKIRK
jgi:hypothetical protein